jgi:hypothetical protein
MATDPGDPLRRPGTPTENDLPPAGAEAGRREKQPVMPVVWIALGLIAVLLFVAALVFVHHTGHVLPFSGSPGPASHG